MKTIILDTSFLVACAEFGIDYEQEFSRILDEKFVLSVVDKTLEELDGLIVRGKKQGMHAKLAKRILAKKDVRVIKTSGGHADKLILDHAVPEECVVATIDAGLKTRLKKNGVELLVIRQKKYVMLE